jgi:hypothetical protein
MLTVVSCLLSCSLGMSTERRLFGNYYLTAPDDDSQLALTYKEPGDTDGYSGIIEQTVFAVGFSKEYIIAKQHPANKAITNYYILPVHSNKRTWGDNHGLIGPLTLEEFERKEKELMIKNLDFTIVYKDLE